MAPKTIPKFTPLSPIEESKPENAQKESVETSVHDTSFNLGNLSGSPDFVLNPESPPLNQQKQLSPDQLLKELTLEQVVRTVEGNRPAEKKYSKSPINLFAKQESIEQLQMPSSKKLLPVDKFFKREIEQNYTLPPSVVTKRRRDQDDEEENDRQKTQKIITLNH